MKSKSKPVPANRKRRKYDLMGTLAEFKEVNQVNAPAEEVLDQIPANDGS